MPVFTDDRIARRPMASMFSGKSPSFQAIPPQMHPMADMFDTRFPGPEMPPPELPNGTNPGVVRNVPDQGLQPPINRNVGGPHGIDALRNAFQNQFVLGEPSSDLSNPQVQAAASAAFQNIINQLGGSSNLRAEIGDARFINRLQEFLGKGTTLDQSGVINIGNGITMNSLRDLGDFNQPFVAGVGGHNPGDPTGGGANAPFGFNRLGNPRQVAGRRDFGASGQGGGSSNFQSNTSARFPGQATGAINNLNRVLSQIFNQPRGLTPDTLQRQANLINTGAAQREQQGLRALANQFNTAGQLGGGQLGARSEAFQDSINEQTSNQFNQLSMFNEQLAQQQLQSAIQGALGIGGLSNQMALGRGQLDLQRDLGFADLGLRRDLGFGDLGLRRDLGMGQLGVAQGNLGVAQGHLNLANQGFLSDLGLREFLLNSGIFFPGGLG